MKHLRHYGSFALLLSLLAAGAPAQTPEKPAQKSFEPQVGQAGKDVVWVPTPQALVDQMLDLAKLTPQDFLMDLGSGDGRTVITAAKRGSRAMGIEYNPDMVDLSRRNATEAKVSDRATFEKADLFETDFSKATVITVPSGLGPAEPVGSSAGVLRASLRWSPARARAAPGHAPRRSESPRTRSGRRTGARRARA